MIGNEKLAEILEFKKQSNMHNSITQEVLQDLSHQYSAVSDFQLESTLKILQGLKNRTNKSEGLSIVAGTGAGKSFAFQLPLIIWILSKKINQYFECKRTGKTLHNNCSALLIFPRNILASDQFDSFTELATLINQKIESSITDGAIVKFLKINVERDFGSTELNEKLQIYMKRNPDVIVTNVETLKRRLYDPISHHLYKHGIDLSLF